MKLRALIFLCFAGLMTQPASAQTAPTTVPVTFDSLAAAGYVVEAVSVLSDNATKEVFAGQNLSSQVFVTMQKASSVAVCEFATQTWLTMDNATMKDAARCYKH